MSKKNKIWLISLVSFCWSTSSMMVGSVLPLYLTEVLQVGYARLGYLEGIVVWIAFVSKVFSGILSDYLGSRKWLILIGSIFSVITKPILAVSNNYFEVFFSRFLDRLAKGIRSAPTDALIADLNQEQLNYAFGFRQAMYMLGAVFGAIIAILLMYLFGNNYKLIFYWSIFPGVMAVLILCFVKETNSNKLHTPAESIKFRFSDVKKFNWHYWIILIVSFFLMIARFSESFLTLRVKQLGWPSIWIPLVIIIADSSHSLFAFITRTFSKSNDPEKLLSIGLIALIIANTVWIYANTNQHIAVGIVLIGMHLGITQGVLRTLIATGAGKVNSNINGTAFALFYLVSGCGVFIGNFIAGTLAEKYGLYTIFIGGNIAVGISLILVLLLILNNLLSK